MQCKLLRVSVCGGVHPAVLVSIPTSVLIGQPSELPGRSLIHFFLSTTVNFTFSWSQYISYRVAGKNSKGYTKVRARLALCLRVLRLMGGKGVLVSFYEDDLTGAANDTST